MATRVPGSASILPGLERQTDEEVFLLPGGYVDESGQVHDSAQLSSLSGRDEYLLANLNLENCAATVVTGLLARCVKRIGSLDRVDSSLIRKLLVADRDFLVIKLRLMTFGPRVDCVLRCPDPDCSKLMDLTFSLEDLEIERKPVTQHYIKIQRPVAPGECESERFAGSIEFRFPNGEDQEVCAPRFAIDKEAAAAELLSRCIRLVDYCSDVDGARVSSLSHAQRLEIEERMSQLAPLAEIDMEAACPECGKFLGASFDALTLFLEELTGSFRGVERDVHFLAWHYHWSEQEILSMTRRKRRRYVALVQEEVDRLNQVW